MVYEDLLEDRIVQLYLHELVGPEGMPLAVDPPAGEVTDEELAEERELELNVIRRTLMILNEHDIASYRRERDQESGWLTYLWQFEYQNIPEQLQMEMYRLHDALEERIEYEESNQFYLCDIHQLRFEFDEAYGMGFQCPECGDNLTSIDSSKMVEAMKVRLEELDDELPVRYTDLNES